MSVYEGVQPKPMQNTSKQYNDDLIGPLVVVDVKFATVHMATYGRPEWLVVLVATTLLIKVKTHRGDPLN